MCWGKTKAIEVPAATPPPAAVSQQASKEGTQRAKANVQKRVNSSAGQKSTVRTGASGLTEAAKVRTVSALGGTSK